ncbi:Retrovirus-related Pol polyprotein from transposon TNT 1-94 [Vitis vinifera]|uniref:Retrovirus-related Pol polyprotein from transposon TNT 1-94 n=1 Tax=Vitis vinifera TaxID=29760 RepID=A0A438I8W9_VITVI|nr:Retrovirus-related Pol polyprotein from transposon TNT 1-94 [Vitis vinifera]
MSNITKLEFVALDISGKNYLSWILDAELHLDAMNLGATIKQGNQASLQDRAKALISFAITSMKSRPTGSEPFPEVNAISSQTRGRGRGRGRVVVVEEIPDTMKFNDPKVFVLWHDRLGHPGSSMMRRIIEHSHGHPLKNQKILSPNEYSCAACSQVYVPIAPTQRTKMGPQRRLGVYVGREKSIPEERREISWKTSTMTHLDPRTNQCELEVQRIIHLQNLANQLPDAFIDTKKVTKSHIPAANTPARIDVPIGQLTNESKIRLKRGRPVGSKDVTPRKRRTQEKLSTLEEAIKMTDQFKIDKSIALEEAQIMQKAPEEVHIEQEAPEEAHIEQETPEDPHIEREAPEEAQAELNSLTKREVFGPVVQTPEDVKPVGYKWVFVRKRNENNEIIRYKARLVAQGFSQRPGVDYEETYSPVMDAITFRFLISLAVSEGLDMRLMDVITAYLYGSMDNDIYMKIPEGFKLPDANNTKPRSMYSIKLQRSLYGLKQSGRMWYNRLSEYLLKEGYVNNPICPCIFIKKSETGFAIIAVYVDDLNLVGTPEELTRTTNYLKKEFEMKDLGKTKFCLGLQIEHFPNGVLVHQSTYIKKVLKRFYMDKAHPLSSPMVVRSLDVKKDPFRPCEKDEELLGPEVPYLSAIGALMYLANCTRPDIAFSVNLLARYSSSPTRRHWNGIKHILRYLRGTTDMGLFYSRESKQQLLGYADAGYLSDPHKGRSQTGYVFNYNVLLFHGDLSNKQW